MVIFCQNNNIADKLIGKKRIRNNQNNVLKLDIIGVKIERASQQVDVP